MRLCEKPLDQIEVGLKVRSLVTENIGKVSVVDRQVFRPGRIGFIEIEWKNPVRKSAQYHFDDDYGPFGSEGQGLYNIEIIE